MQIRTVDALRQLYAQPQERAVKKEIRALDVHCRHFIALSPFVVVATANATHDLDASPRGGEPGFVKVTSGGELLIPDAPGNYWYVWFDAPIGYIASTWEWCQRSGESLESWWQSPATASPPSSR